MIRKNITDLKIQEQVDDFLAKYESYYSKQERDFISRNAIWGRLADYTSSELEQIYDELGLRSPEVNIYLKFCQLLKEIFGLEQKILEVAGGKIPSLARYIAICQNKGTITVMDPELIIKNYLLTNMILKKEAFTSKTSLKDCELLIGLMPLKLNILMIKKACQENKNFMIALSNVYCNLEDDYDGRFTLWQESQIFKASEITKQYYNQPVKTLVLKTDSLGDIPVIYHKN